MKYCEQCGKELKKSAKFCPSCGMEVKKEVVEATVVNNNANNTTSIVKDNTTLGFVLSLIGALCCTYLAIPGLIISIQSLKDINEGKINSDKKWMAICGIILSAVGIFQMFWNFTHIDQAQERIRNIIEQYSETIGE